MLCVLSHDLNTINGRVAFQPCILGIQDVGATNGGGGCFQLLIVAAIGDKLLKEFLFNSTHYT